jgi:(1->4)-alpha-D-glucan 1-alpha-D-glucosylmutase
VGLERRGGWGETSVVLPWPSRDVLTDVVHEPGRLQVDSVLDTLPVALLIPEEATS